MKELALALGITVGAVRKAILDGRITPESYTQIKRQYVFDSDRALSDFNSRTLKNMSRTKDDDDTENEADEEAPFEQKAPEKSPLGVPKEEWTLHQASLAKTIKQFEKADFELQLMMGKFYSKTETDNEILRITNVFARNLSNLTAKLDLKFGEDFSQRQRLYIEELVKEILDSCSSQLDPATGEDEGS